MNVREYLRKNKGIKSFEGSLYNQSAHQDLLKKLIHEKKRGLEIGFNAGDSAELFLSEGCDLISFDIGRHSYTRLAKEFLDLQYPNKHKLVIGNSTKTIPEHQGQAGLYDFIYIDGCHRYEIASQDIMNCRKLSHKDTQVLSNLLRKISD